MLSRPTRASWSAGISCREPTPHALPDTPLTTHAQAPGLTHTSAAAAPSLAGARSADAQAPGPPALQTWAALAPVCPALGPAGGSLLWTPPSCPSRGGWVVDSPSHQPEWIPEWVPPPPRRMLCGGPQGHRAPAGPWSLRRSPLSLAWGRVTLCLAAQLGAGPAWPVQGREAAAGCVGGRRAPSSGRPGSLRGPAHSPLPAPAMGPDTLPASVRGYSRSWWPPSGP